MAQFTKIDKGFTTQRWIVLAYPEEVYTSKTDCDRQFVDVQKADGTIKTVEIEPIDIEGNKGCFIGLEIRKVREESPFQGSVNPIKKKLVKDIVNEHGAKVGDTLSSIWGYTGANKI